MYNMWKLTAIFLLILNLQVFGQQVTVADKKHFKIDSTEFSIAGIKYIKRINEPFVTGGDARFARKSDISFQLKNANSISVRFGDSLDIQYWLNFKQTETEYFSFDGEELGANNQMIYSYTLTQHPENGIYNSIATSVVMNGKKYFVMVDANLGDLDMAFKLIADLQELVGKLII